MRTSFFLLFLLLGFTLAGCTNRLDAPDKDETTAANTSAELLASYHPRVVKLIEVFVNTTVLEPFPNDTYPQHYHVQNGIRFERMGFADWFKQNRTPPYDLDHKTLVANG